MKVVSAVRLALLYDVSIINPRVQESSVAVSKATELFIELLVKKAHEVCVAHNKKTLRYEDILEAIDDENNAEQFQFLQDAFGPART